MGVEYEIVGVPSQGSWELNCAYKPFFLMEMLKRLQKPLLWVDADAVFVRTPRWVGIFEADIAVRINASLSDDHDSKVASGTIFVNHTEGARKVLGAWQRETSRLLCDPERKVEFWDQISLRNVLLKEKEAKIAPLPLEYIKIFDHPLDAQEIPDPVIVHYQASRRLKKLV